MKYPRFQALLPFLLLSSLALVSQLAFGGTPIDEAEAANPDGRVKIDLVSGSLRVIGWDQSQVAVTGELGEGAELRFRADGDRTLVSVRKKSGVRRMKPTHLVVRLPQGSELGASAVSAGIEVEAMLGDQRLETVAGSIDAQLASEEIDLTTVSGSIRLAGEGQAARLDASSVSGSIRVEELAGEVEMTSVSGGLRLEAGLLKRVELNSTSGSIRAELGLAPASRLEAETISGGIRLTLANPEDLRVDIETFSGRIDSCFEEQPQRKQRHGPGKSLRFERGAADRSVRVESLSGSVKLCSASQR